MPWVDLGGVICPRVITARHILSYCMPHCDYGDAEGSTSWWCVSTQTTQKHTELHIAKQKLVATYTDHAAHFEFTSRIETHVAKQGWWQRHLEMGMGVGAALEDFYKWTCLRPYLPGHQCRHVLKRQLGALVCMLERWHTHPAGTHAHTHTVARVRAAACT